MYGVLLMTYHTLDLLHTFVTSVTQIHESIFGNQSWRASDFAQYS